MKRKNVRKKGRKVILHISVDCEGNISTDQKIRSKDEEELRNMLRRKFKDKINAANLIVNKDKLTVVYEEFTEENEDGDENPNRFELVSESMGRTTLYLSDN